MTVIDFPQRRQAGDRFTCADCGGEWFDLLLNAPAFDGKDNGSVLLNLEGGVTGYAGLPVCRDCGRIYEPTSFLHQPIVGG